MASHLRLALSSDPSNAKRLRNDLRAWLLESGINGTIGSDIIVAANEAFINAVEHPRKRTSSTIEVTGEVGEHQVLLHVRDRGRWQGNSDPGRGHYGQQLMRTLMTEITIDCAPTGTVVTLRRTL